jgi:uncharacterized membrane protein HdeD (DUF308 family)
MTDHAITTATKIRSKTSAAPGLWLVVAFSVIGLLLTLNVITHFPEWGALIAQYNQF